MGLLFGAVDPPTANVKVRFIDTGIAVECRRFWMLSANRDAVDAHMLWY